jgi:hypothetical protein
MDRRGTFGTEHCTAMPIDGTVALRVYYEPRGESALNRTLMRLFDEQYTRTPFFRSKDDRRVAQAGLQRQSETSPAWPTPPLIFRMSFSAGYSLTMLSTRARLCFTSRSRGCLSGDPSQGILFDNDRRRTTPKPISSAAIHLREPVFLSEEWGVPQTAIAARACQRSAPAAICYPVQRPRFEFSHSRGFHITVTAPTGANSITGFRVWSSVSRRLPKSKFRRVVPA